MPIYEYYCADCQTKFDALRPMSQADTPIQCQACESPKTSRVLSLFAAHTGGDSHSGPALSAGNGGFSGCGCGGGGCGCGH